MKTRYDAFLKSLSNDPVNRAIEVAKEIQFVKDHIDEMLKLQDAIDEGKISLRITHNDTKINNILFDKNDLPVCIIDLDIVMPGSVLFDFGDSIRTIANTASEEETNLSQVNFNMSMFEAFSKGYAETAKGLLTENEIEYLALSVKYITFIMGLRFLTDFIDGDHYYKIKSKKHNLQRTQNQFHLVNSIDKHFEEMRKFISRVFFQN